MRTAVLVGVEGAGFAWSNIVEQAVIDTVDWTVATGLDASKGIGTRGVVCDGRQLPFLSRAFDVAISNAVVEHVGDSHDQQRFVDEHHRVARRFVITTPNLLFPVESHTRVLFRHWSRRWRARHVEQFTRLLTRRGFARLLPAETTISGHWWSPTFVAVHMCGPGCD